MVKLFKSKVLSRKRGVSESGIDNLTGITSKNNKTTANGLSQHTQSKVKNMTADDSETQFTNIFEDPKLKNEYQLMTTAAKKASFGQCFFARHRRSGDIVMIMAIQNEFMHKFQADLSDASKLKSVMAAVDPSLNGLREMIGLSKSTALILDVDMNPKSNKDKNEIVMIEDHTTVQESTTTTRITEADEPFDDFGSWLQYWVCGAPTNLLLCNALPNGVPALTDIPECSDENTDSSNIRKKSGTKHNRSFGAKVNVTSEDVRLSTQSVGTTLSAGVLSRIVDVDDATTVATSKRISQHNKIRSRKNSSKYYRNVAAEIASTDGSKTLPSVFSMDSHSIPPEEDWFSMLDQLLTPDLR